MRVILEIPEDALEKLGELAKLQKRSRKNFMEYILVNHTECAEYIAPESITGILSQNKPIEGNVSKTKESVRNVAQNKPDVKIQDLTNQSKTNYSIDTTAKVVDIRTDKNGVVKLDLDAQIEILTKAANSCSDTPLGRKAKANYLKQITELQSLLKIK